MGDCGVGLGCSEGFAFDFEAFSNCLVVGEVGKGVVFTTGSFAGVGSKALLFTVWC